MVKDGAVFKTACGLYVREAAYDDMSYLGRDWVWCYCPYDKREGECASRIPLRGFNHCEPQRTDEEYDAGVSVERALDKRDAERHAAFKAFYEKCGEKFKRCQYLNYDFRTKRIKANGEAIKSCLMCGHCAWIKDDDGAEAKYRVVCDVTVTERYNCGDLFGDQEAIAKYERYPLTTSNVYHTESMCNRYIKNENPEWMFHPLDEIRIGGFRWGGVRDVYLAYTPSGYFASRGWNTGEITVEHGEPYLIAKATRKTPQMALLAKAEKEAKQEHRRDIYRKRIRKLLAFEPVEGDADALVESRLRKLRLLRERYPDLYGEESDRLTAKNAKMETQRTMGAAQLSLF